MIDHVLEAECRGILANIERKAAQKYLKSQIRFPGISPLKIRLLYLFLYSQSYPVERIRSLCTAMGLVQMGLDIHDDVNNGKVRTERRIRTRQLQVLAGDYFSSQYYSLLAEEGEIEAISLLSEAVGIVNKRKADLYRIKATPENRERWLELKTEIESALVRIFVPDGQSLWARIIEQFIRMDLLMFGNLPKEWSIPHVAGLIQTSLQQLKDLVASFPHGPLQEAFRQMLAKYEPFQANHLVLEEY